MSKPISTYRAKPPATSSRKDKSPSPASPRGGERGGGGLWLYGIHPVLAALANSERRCRRLLMTVEARHSLQPRLDALSREHALPAPEPVEREALDRLLPRDAVHQGVALQADPLPAPGIEDLGRLAEGRAQSVVMVLDQVTDPHNVGAILRSAAAFGALALVVPDRNAPEETGVLAKSASGALELVPLVRVTNLARALDQLKADGFWCAGLAADAPETLAEAKLSGRIALVLGSEGEGLRRLTREHCDRLVRLPMSGAMESLNVSNAAAVALYELMRA